MYTGLLYKADSISTVDRLAIVINYNVFNSSLIYLFTIYLTKSYADKSGATIAMLNDDHLHYTKNMLPEKTLMKVTITLVIQHFPGVYYGELYINKLLMVASFFINLQLYISKLYFI